MGTELGGPTQRGIRCGWAAAPGLDASLAACNLLTRASLQCRAPEVSQAEATATRCRPRFDRRRHDDDLAVGHRRRHDGLLDSTFALGSGLSRRLLSLLARLDTSDQPGGAAALLSRHLARDITFEVHTGVAGCKGFLVHQAVDVSLQHG